MRQETTDDCGLVVLNDADFEKACQYWKNAEGVALTIPRSVTPQTAEAMGQYLLQKLPHNVAAGLLSDVAERPGISARLLEEIFDRGDTACKVSVCLRTDLSSNLEQKCNESPIDDVREHWQSRVTRAAQQKP